jgi:hypothetical protein
MERQQRRSPRFGHGFWEKPDLFSSTHQLYWLLISGEAALGEHGLNSIVALISGLASLLAGSTLLREVFRPLIRDIFGVNSPSISAA